MNDHYDDTRLTNLPWFYPELFEFFNGGIFIRHKRPWWSGFVGQPLEVRVIQIYPLLFSVGPSGIFETIPWGKGKTVMSLSQLMDEAPEHIKSFLCFNINKFGDLNE